MGTWLTKNSRPSNRKSKRSWRRLKKRLKKRLRRGRFGGSDGDHQREVYANESLCQPLRETNHVQCPCRQEDGDYGNLCRRRVRLPSLCRSLLSSKTFQAS